MYNRNDDYKGTSNALVPSMLSDKTNFNVLLDVQSESFQNIEDILYTIMEDTYFLTAKGYNLNRYGQIFGIKRSNDTPDEDFRWHIITEISRRGSTGNIEQVRQMFEAVTGQSNSRVFNIPTLSFMYYGYIDDFTYKTTVPRQAAIALRKAMPPTVGSVVFGIADSNKTLFVPEELVDDYKFLVTQDDDYIVNETDDYIVAKSDSLKTVAVDVITSGILSEPYATIANATSKFALQDETSLDTEYEDTFIVQIPEGEETDTVDFYVEGEGVDVTYALLLEINQIYYNEVLPK